MSLFSCDLHRLSPYTFLCTLQDEIFQLVGAPLVENCLAGFNSSVFAYGQVCLSLGLNCNFLKPDDCKFDFGYYENTFHQTGSGKTYTMWGPANGLLEEHLSGDQRGLTPRVFELLFARISEVMLCVFLLSVHLIL